MFSLLQRNNAFKYYRITAETVGTLLHTTETVKPSKYCQKKDKTLLKYNLKLPN